MNFRKKIRDWVRYDGLAILFFFFTLCIMTYPLVFKLGSIIPMDGTDIYPAIWQNWWIREVLTHGLDLNFTEYLFYPNGLDLTLQPRRWTSYPIWAFLDAIFGLPGSYNITVLMQSLVKAYAMYRFILLFVNSRKGAWLGGAYYAFSARMLASAIEKPNTGAQEFIPIFMIFFVVALRYSMKAKSNQDRHAPVSVIALMSLAGLAFSANVYMNIKIGMFAAFMGGLYLIWVFFVHRLWLYKLFWLGITAFLIVSSITSAPILVPALTYSELDNAIELYEPGVGIDPTLYIKPDARYPVFYHQWIASLDNDILDQSYHRGLAHFGMPALVVALLGCIYILRYRRDQAIWIIISLLFFLLSLGIVLQINGHLYPQIPLPYQLLSDNIIFVALREPFRFMLLLVFGLSVLIAFGIQWRFRHFRGSHKTEWLWFGGISIIILIQTSIFPIQYRDDNLSDVYKFIATEDTGAIIHLPIGRNQSKYYMYAQTLHQQPIVEGMTARIPEGVYDYWDTNLLLESINTKELIPRNEELLNQLHENWKQVMDDLLESGFRYVVRTKDFGDSRLKYLITPDHSALIFGDAIPIWETENVIVYDIVMLRDNPIATE